MTEVKTFLGMEISKNEKGLKITQTRMITRLLEEFSMTETRKVATPIRLICSLMYLSLASRPDISYSVAYLSRFRDKPRKSTWEAGERILRYLNHTKEYGLQFKKGNMQELMALCDADWRGDQESRKSESGFVCFHAGNPIAWHSRKQKCVAQSLMEAEYISAGIASQELVNLKGILSEFKKKQEMIDVEPKTPNKRKSAGGGKRESPKKTKLENVKTPKKTGPPQQQKSPQNIAKKDNKNIKQNNGSPAKKLKPFAGTSLVGTPKGKPEKKVQKDGKPAQKKSENQEQKKKNQYFQIKEKLKSEDKAERKEVVKIIDVKLKQLESRSALTKSAMRRMKMLKRFRRIAEGEAPPPPQQKQPNPKADSTKRRDRRKKAIKAAIEGKVIKKEDSKAKVNQQPKAKIQKVTKKALAKVKQDSEEESDDEDEVEQNEEEDESGEEGSEEEESGEEEAEESGEESDEDEDESEEDSPPPQVKKPKMDKNKKESKGGGKDVNLQDLMKNDMLAKNQKRYVVFVGNIPYDTKKNDLVEHFQQCGEIKHVRIPTEKKSDKPRGFAYVEVANEEIYQKCLSKHHTFLKGRRVNVLYTQTGKKKGDDKKKEIKAKNFKLDALRKKGILLGSKKESQKRSFRRKKNISKEAGTENT
ncbi:hypothetical protein JTB14_004770 [Gonioctena quinquepunctata]|nr:hypothetical protein JTB14_004770 [Gonioctena quinquepunctata]